jgi:hypothetical protein
LPPWTPTWRKASEHSGWWRFVVVAAPACLGPSWRASRISPLVAFRAE